jgi:serine/threonine protein kinase
MTELIAEGTRILDRYIVDKRLGAGAMGEVWRARHERLGVLVAVKVLNAECTDHASVVRFQREAKMMALVRHPNVLSVVDFGMLTSEAPCLVIEYVEGQNLDDLLSVTGRLNWRTAVNIVCGILEGLTAIHDAGILHRDMKPGNVMVFGNEPNYRVKIVDFGIAREGDPSVSKLTKTGMLVGTPVYMAPEVLMGQRKADVQTDIFAVGTMMYELIAGVLPWEAENMMDLAIAVSRGPAPIAEVFPPVVLPPTVEAVIARALGVRRAERWTTAEEFREALVYAAHPSTIEAARLASPPPAVETAPASTSNDDDLLEVAAPPTLPMRRLMVAKLPASRLAKPDERKWLATIVGRARAFTMAGQYWFVLLTEEQVAGVATEIGKRYGTASKLIVREVAADFALTPAMLIGGGTLPGVLADAIDALSK